MSGLFGTMSTALSALQAEQGALEATTNNVANANTPGFSRQRAIMVESDPVVQGSLSFGTGVSLQLQSLRDPILELRLNQETQQQGQLDAQVSAMQQIETMFSSDSGDLGSLMTSFFNSVDQLSTDPSSMPLRQGVLTAAGNMANGFRNTARNLQQQQSNIDLNVGQTVDQVNVLTKQIADLNGEISGMQNLSEDPSTFLDQRTNLIRQLSQLVDVAVVQSDNSIAVTTSAGTALVEGQQSFNLSTQLSNTGVQEVMAQGADITSKISAGKLGGLIQVRDQTIPSILGQLDTLAGGLSTALNAANRSGSDLTGTAGGALFTAPPASGTGAAADMTLLITDPSLLAASSDGTPGSNGNLAKFTAVSTQTIASGQTPTDYYANLVFQIGSDVSNGTAESDASNLILQQLQDQRASLSGVSLDEEAANLVRYQQSYSAAARVVSTLNDLLDTAVNLGKD